MLSGNSLAELAEFVARTSYPDLPPDVISKAQSILYRAVGFEAPALYVELRSGTNIRVDRPLVRDSDSPARRNSRLIIWISGFTQGSHLYVAAVARLIILLHAYTKQANFGTSRLLTWFSSLGCSLVSFFSSVLFL